MPEFRRLKWLFVLIPMVLFQLSAVGQNKKTFVVTGKIVPEVATSENGAIELSKSGAETTRIDIPRNGRFRLELEYFNEFTLVFSLPGHFSKTILVSTEIPQEVWERDNDFPPFPMIVQLFKEIEGIDKSFTLKASGKVFYGKQTDNFEKESIFNDIEIAEQINNATARAGQVKKEAQGITKQEAQDLAAKEKNFDQAVTEADVLYRRGEFQPALLKYREANQLFPEKVYPNDRIAELQDLVKAMEITEKQKAELEQKYQEAIAQANRLFDQQTYLQARPGYEQALQYKAGDAYASGRIVEIDQLLALQAQEEKQKLAQQAELEKEFSQAIENGDNLARQKDYLQALSSYQRALELKPNNQLAMDKISATQQQIAILDKDKQYQEAIQAADLALAATDLEKAKMHYLEALKLKAGEPYATSKLAEIKVIQTNETIFIELLANAEKAVSNQKYDQAISIYRDALKIKPNNTLAQDKISEVEQILINLDKQQQYLALIAQADQSFDQKDFPKAQADYRKSLTINPDETYPANRLTEIEEILEKEQQAKAVEEQYQSVIARADKSFDSLAYDQARSSYSEALTLKPNEAHPTQRMARIDEILAEKEAYQKSMQEAQDQSFLEAMNTGDKAFSENDFTSARKGYQTALAIKKDNPEAKQKLGQTDAKIAELARLTLAYNAAITAANKQVENKLYPEAKEKYEEALQYLPDADYPKRQIERLNELLAQVEAERQKEEMYAAKIKEGESLLGNKDYGIARSAFVQASEIKPSEVLPLRRISEIDKILSDLALENAKNQTIESAYQEAIRRADQRFEAKEYLAAQLVYGEALAIKPNEQYPKNRVAEIEKLLADLKIQQYNQVIEAGDLAFKSDQLDQATTQYELALTFKNNDPYARQQLNEIAKRRVVLLAEKEELKKLEDQYKSLMATANSDFMGKDYQEAKVKYQKASSLKPHEALPKERIAQIDVFLGELANAQETDRLYEESIKAGQLAFEQNKLIEARDAYQKAYNLKSYEPMPPIRIAELNLLIAELEQSERQKALLEAQRLAKEKADRELYEKAIVIADKSFAAKQLLVSRIDYTNALSILPEEKYPQDQLKIIDRLLAQQESINPDGIGTRQQAMNDSIMELNEMAYNQLIATAKELENSKQYQDAILKYREAIGLKPQERENIERLIASLEAMIRLSPRELGAQEVIAAAPVVPAPALSVDESNQEIPKQVRDVPSYEVVPSIRDYDEVIRQADDAFGIKDYAVARFYYYKASESKPVEEYPRNQIDLIRKLVDSELSSVDRSGYQEAIDLADDAFQKNNYTVAKFYYYKALGIKSWEKYPKDRIQEILALTNSLLSEREEQEYRDLIARGDEAYTIKDIAIARFYYNKAISMKRDEDYPRIKLKDIEKIIDQDRQELRNREYNQLIEQADQAMQGENYSIARFNYNKALGMRPNEKYPKDQLKRIKEALDK